jgi:nitrate reductase alpha subunit
MVIQVAREFAQNADQTHGKSMVIVGAALNHWYHMDMSYRGIINMLMMCGCIGQSGGGWATMWARKNCVRKPAGHRWPLLATGYVRHAR